MIITKLIGGMGNQLFQYAFARNLSIKFSKKLKIDISPLLQRDYNNPLAVHRDYDLNIFNIYEDLYIDCIKIDHQYTEPHFHYSESIVKLIEQDLIKNKTISLSGFWQSPLYFKEHENTIKKDFEFKNMITSCHDTHIKNMLYDIQSTQSIMINIRRTDYLNTDFHGVMGIDYINEALKIINQKIKSPKYFIFSDDIEWCKSNILLDNMVIVDHSYKGTKFEYYLQLMKNCKHFIIPNSTFAWWSAWLNNNPYKIVISPKKWFAKEYMNTNDLIPKDWIRI